MLATNFWCWCHAFCKSILKFATTFDKKNNFISVGTEISRSWIWMDSYRQKLLFDTDYDFFHQNIPMYLQYRPKYQQNYPFWTCFCFLIKTCWTEFLFFWLFCLFFEWRGQAIFLFAVILKFVCWTEGTDCFYEGHWLYIILILIVQYFRCDSIWSNIKVRKSAPFNEIVSQ